jgi:hypothetical protein
MATYRPASIFQIFKRAIQQRVFVRLNNLKFKRQIQPKKKEKKRIFSEAQLHQQSRFRQGQLYGKHAVTIPELSRRYARNAKGNQGIYHIAMKDFLNAPRVTGVEYHAYLADQMKPIVISAEDDFEVVVVAVKLYDSHENLLEQGFAVQKKAHWYYQPQLEHPPPGMLIEVVAKDLAGNEGKWSGAGEGG